MTVLHRFSKPRGHWAEIRERKVTQWRAIEFLIYVDGSLLESQLFHNGREAEYPKELDARIKQSSMEDGLKNEPTCRHCLDGWVCEEHPDRPYGTTAAVVLVNPVRTASRQTECRVFRQDGFRGHLRRIRERQVTRSASRENGPNRPPTNATFRSSSATDYGGHRGRRLGTDPLVLLSTSDQNSNTKRRLGSLRL